MITMILNTLFSFALFVSGGHVIDTKLSLHHYSDDDYKEIFYLKNKASISKNCLKHSEVEDIKKIKSHRDTENGGETVTNYKVTKNDALEKVEKKEEN
jgi:hypothetical protein